MSYTFGTFEITTCATIVRDRESWCGNTLMDPIDESVRNANEVMFIFHIVWFIG